MDKELLSTHSYNPLMIYMSVDNNLKSTQTLSEKIIIGTPILKLKEPNWEEIRRRVEAKVASMILLPKPFPNPPEPFKFQKLVNETEVDSMLKQGWIVVAQLKTGVIVENSIDINQVTNIAIEHVNVAINQININKIVSVAMDQVANQTL